MDEDDDDEALAPADGAAPVGAAPVSGTASPAPVYSSSISTQQPDAVQDNTPSHA